MNTRNVWFFGLLAGALVSAGLILGVWLGRDSVEMMPGLLFGYGSSVLACGILVYGLRSMDRTTKLRMPSLALAGMGMSALAASIYTISWMLYLRISGYDFAEHYLRVVEHQLLQKGRSSEEIAHRMAEISAQMADYDKPLVQAMLTFSEVFPIFLIAVLAASYFISKKELKKTQASAK